MLLEVLKYKKVPHLEGLSSNYSKLLRVVYKGSLALDWNSTSSVHTITTHRKNIFRKLGVNTAHEVIKYALRAGLVDSSEFYI